MDISNQINFTVQVLPLADPASLQVLTYIPPPSDSVFSTMDSIPMNSMNSMGDKATGVDRSRVQLISRKGAIQSKNEENLFFLGIVRKQTLAQAAMSIKQNEV